MNKLLSNLGKKIRKLLPGGDPEGTVALVLRSPDRSGPESAGCFANRMLDKGYSILDRPYLLRVHILHSYVSWVVWYKNGRIIKRERVANTRSSLGLQSDGSTKYLVVVREGVKFDRSMMKSVQDDIASDLIHNQWPKHARIDTHSPMQPPTIAVVGRDW